MNKEYHCIPPKSKVLFFESDTPAELFIKYKSAPYQKINQQTCTPAEVEVKGPKTRGRQISIKDVSTINSKPPRLAGPGSSHEQAAIHIGHIGRAVEPAPQSRVG